MANTLTNVARTNVLQDTLIPAARMALAPVTAISTTITENELQIGETLKIPLVTAMTASSYSGNFATGDSTTTSASGTITSAMRSWHVSPGEVLATPARYAAMGAEAAKSVGKAIVDAVAGLYTEANVGTGAANEINVAVANFDSDDVADALVLLNAKGSDDASLLVSAGGYGSLRKDNAIEYQANSGMSVLQDGNIPAVLGQPTHNMNALPTAISDENTYGLLVGKASAGLVLGRFPQVDLAREQAAGVSIMEITDEESGLTLTVREWVDANTGFHWGSVYTAYAVAYGQDVAIRIATA